MRKLTAGCAGCWMLSESITGIGTRTLCWKKVSKSANASYDSKLQATSKASAPLSLADVRKSCRAARAAWGTHSDPEDRA